MSDFKRLFVWRKANELVSVVYRLLKAMPPDERDNLTDQIRRSVGSISSNIAESANKRTLKDRRKYITHAYGSALELENELLIVKNASLVPHHIVDPCLALVPHVERLLNCYYKRPCPPDQMDNELEKKGTNR